jgi:hypothetical protein
MHQVLTLRLYDMDIHIYCKSSTALLYEIYLYPSCKYQYRLDGQQISFINFLMD